MHTITLHTHDDQQVTLDHPQGHTLAQSIFLAGLWEGVPLCAGLGRCGLCKVRFLQDAPAPQAEELKRFSEDDLHSGWRLACLHPPRTCELELPEPPARKATPHLVKSIAGPLSLAVDLGTTSVHWQAFSGAETVAEGTALNPQIGLGSEVMARLAFARTTGGAAILRQRIVDHLRDVMTSLPGPVEQLAISGNPTMAAFLLGLDTTTLAAAPYALPDVCGKTYTLAPDLPDAYVPPLFSPFVGADLSAGLAALHFDNDAPEPPYLLADLGTNGEFILETTARRIVASVPMGPALEGVGLSCGTTAGPGVITAFRLAPGGLLPVYGAGAPASGSLPAGMTGTASLSLCALLLRNGLMTPEGGFTGQDGSGTTALAKRLSRLFTTIGGEPALTAVPNTAIHLTASDVEEILKVKAAFNLAFTALLREAALNQADLSSLLLAGAMGEHVGLDDLERLGFIPSGMTGRTLRRGNTSLAGTRLLLESAAAREWLENEPRPTVLDLASSTDFGTQYLERMVFTHVA